MSKAGKYLIVMTRPGDLEQCRFAVVTPKGHLYWTPHFNIAEAFPRKEAAKKIKVYADTKPLYRLSVLGVMEVVEDTKTVTALGELEILFPKPKGSEDD